MTPGISGNEPGETSETIKMTSLGFPEKWSVTIQKRSMIEQHERKGQDGGGEMVESDAPVRSTEERDDAERGKETMLSSVEGI